MDVNLDDFYVAVETRDALERQDLRMWQQTSFLFGSSYHTLEFISAQGGPRRLFTESPDRKPASILPA